MAAQQLPGAQVAPAGNGDDFTLADLGRLNQIPDRTWGVSGQDPNRTQTETLEVLVWDFAQIGDRMFVGGGFLNVQETRTSTPISQPFVAAFDVDSGEWISTWRPDLDRAVYSLDVAPNGSLLVGGEFEQVNGVARKGLVALDPITGQIDPTFEGRVDRPWATLRAVVREVVVEGSDVYVAGNFSHLEGKGGSRHRVFKAGRFGADAEIDTTWRPEVTGSGVWGMDLDPSRGEVHLTGFFSAVNGEENTGNFHTVNATDGASAPNKKELPRNFPAAQPEMYDVAVGDDRIFVSGEQHVLQILDPGDHTMVGYHHTGQRNDDFVFERGFAGGAFQLAERVGDVVIAGCHCTFSARTVDGELKLSHYSSYTGRRTGHRVFMAYDASTGRLIESFLADINSPADGAWAATVDSNNCLYVGGDVHVGGVDADQARWLGGFGRFCPTDQVPAPAPIEDPAPADDPVLAPADQPAQDPAPAPAPAPADDPVLAPADQPAQDPAPAKDPEPIPVDDPDDGPAQDPAPAKDPEAGEAAPEPVPAEDPAPAPDPQPAGEAAPEPVPAEEPVQVDQQAPAEDPVPAPAPVDQQAPAEDPVPAPAPVDQQAPAEDPVPAPAPVDQPAPAQDADPADEQAPAPLPIPVDRPATDPSGKGPEPIGPDTPWAFDDSGTRETRWWRKPGYGHGHWSTATGEFGFGEGDETTVLRPGHRAYFFRTDFDHYGPNPRFLKLTLKADDGAVVYLNGKEILRDNLPEGPIDHRTRPLVRRFGSAETARTFTVPADALVQGENVVAVQVSNFSRSSSDVSFDMTLESSDQN